MQAIKDEIARQSLQFAIEIVDLYRSLVNLEKEYVMSKQLLKSGTAIGALVREAQNAESTADFIHKLSIAQKECAESQYWLELLKDSDYISDVKYDRFFDDSTSILKMIRSAIITTKRQVR